MSRPLLLPAPAKLNLYLRILGRRADGFHELETLFERIDLADELTFRDADDAITLTCSDPALSCAADNLVVKAAALLQRSAKTQQGASIHLTKRTPVGAGLGGGSSDAATTLIGLNRLWQLQLPISQLKELAAELGSDVAFFLEQQAFAIGTGRGERLEPLPDLSATLWHVLVVPTQRLSTADIYAGYAAARATPNGAPPSVGAAGRSSWRGSALSGSTVAESRLTETGPSLTMTVHALRNGPDLSGLAAGLWNTLEPEAIRRCPAIQDIRNFLRNNGCVGWLTSGSGSAVFGLCRNKDHVQQVADRVRADGSRDWQVIVVRTFSGRVDERG